MEEGTKRKRLHSLLSSGCDQLLEAPAVLTSLPLCSIPSIEIVFLKLFLLLLSQYRTLNLEMGVVNCLVILVPPPHPRLLKLLQVGHENKNF